ncbi:MAG: DUF192 domain-containing protein [Bryobacteraceae bacterium]|nr:DUF192 domain-containing protein [Bryobacteraceae bacterium]MDW8378291.1 DUF192 domain-containing protein [Bryobacterales bacterium]
MALRAFVFLAGLLALVACFQPSSPPPELYLRTIILPGGHRISAEVLLRRDDMARGMMFRKALPADRGLLFVHPKPGLYKVWMHNVQTPLDIIWMDKEKTIVEIHANTPPCREPDPVRCPQYGGSPEAQFVLELAAGLAQKFGLREGQKLEF